MVFVLIEILYFTYVRFLGFSILILSDPYQGYSTRQSVQTLDTTTRPEQFKRIVQDALFAVQKIPNYTRYSTVFNSRAVQYAQFCVRAWRITFPKTIPSAKASV